MTLLFMIFLAKIKILTLPKVDKNVEALEQSHTTGMTTLENSLPVS